MDWSKLGLIAIAVFMLWQFYRLHRQGGLRAVFEKSRQSPQHWGTFAFLMVLIVIFVIFLIKL